MGKSDLDKKNVVPRCYVFFSWFLYSSHSGLIFMFFLDGCLGFSSGFLGFLVVCGGFLDYCTGLLLVYGGFSIVVV